MKIMMKTVLAVTLLSCLMLPRILAGSGPSPKTTDQGLKFVPKRVNAAAAEGSAKSFIGKGASFAVVRVGGLTKCKYAPSLTCDVFDMPLGVQAKPNHILHRNSSVKGGYTVSSKPGQWIHAKICVEEATGRVLAYTPDESYTLEKNRKRPPLRKADLMTKNNAIKLAEGYMRRAGLYASDMRLTHFFRERWQDANYLGYNLVFSSYKPVAGVGEVEFPEKVLITLDAETGELDDLLYEQRVVQADLTPPRISKDKAIQLAQSCLKPEEAKSTDARLIVYVDPDPEGSKDQALAWRVDIYNSSHQEGNPLEAAIDAHTGKVIYYTAWDHGL
jgi:hypothetical protein